MGIGFRGLWGLSWLVLQLVALLVVVGGLLSALYVVMGGGIVATIGYN